jgi:hypothetical protein
MSAGIEGHQRIQRQQDGSTVIAARQGRTYRESFPGIVQKGLSMAKKNATQESGGVAETKPAVAAPMQGVNKQQAIAEAMRELGRDASTADLIGYARQKFGVEVSPGYVSVIKSNLKKKQRKKTLASASAAEPVNGRKQKEASTVAADPVQMIRDVKALAKRAGGMQALKRLVDVLAE